MPTTMGAGAAADDEESKGMTRGVRDGDRGWIGRGR